MKVLHIIAGDLNGGAARGAYWLHEGLINLNVESKIFTNSRNTLSDENITSSSVNITSAIINIIRKKIDRLPEIFYRKRERKIFNSGIIGYDFTKTKEYIEADIIHLHWINEGFVNMKTLNKINKPIVWTIRDMWPFTGGCHYSIECTKYKTGCGNCDQLNSNTNYDLSRLVVNRKKRYIPKSLKIIGISNWITEQAKNSFLFKNFDVRTIENNINTKNFIPIDKKNAKKILNISTNKKIILAGATSLNHFYKGFDKYLEALKYLDKNEYILCFFGTLDNSIAENLGFEYKSFGFLHDNISLRILYSAADVFVAPSIMDAFGKTIAEAMSCGTPTVCFNATGPRDIVDHKINGYLAKAFEPSDMANGIRWVLDNNNSKNINEKARNKIVTHFDSEVVAKKYIELYNETLNT